MKTCVIFLIGISFSFVFSISFSESFAIPLVDDDVFITVSTIVRNSDGVLVLYLESTKFTDIDFVALNSFLDYEADYESQIIIDDNQQYEVIRRVQSFVYDHEDFRGGTSLYGDIDGSTDILLVNFAHDGYFVYPGDTLYLIWTFVRHV